MLNKSFLIFLIVFSCTHAQNFQENTIYIERNPDVEEKIDKAIIKQLQNKTTYAVSEYSSILKMVSGIVVKYRISNFNELKKLESVIEKYKEKKFSFQKKKGKINFILYAQEILASLNFLISPDDLKILSSKYQNDKKSISTLWPLYNNNNVGGWNIGMQEYLHKLLIHTSKKAKKRLLFSKEEQVEVLKKAWNKNDPEVLEAFLSKNPMQLHYPDSWLQLGDLYFSSGRMGDAYNAWRMSLQFHPKHKKNLLIAKSAIAAYLNQDMNIYKRFYRKFRRSKKKIKIAGKTIRLGDFITKIPNNFKAATLNNWPTFNGNNSHNANVVDLNASNISEKEVLVQQNTFQTTKKVYLPVFAEGSFFLRQSNELICIDFDDILRTKNSRLVRKKWIYKNKAVIPQKNGKMKNIPEYDSLTYANGCVYFFARTTERETYSKIVALDAKNGQTLWEWPKKNLKKMHLNFAPIVVGNKLYASATIFGGETSTEVYCFDIKNDHDLLQGKKRYNRDIKLDWRQFIGSAMENNLYTQTQKLSVGSGLVSGYGKIYSCNNLGIVAAIDALDGHIHWVNEYHFHKKQKYQLRSNAVPRKIRWKNIPPIIKNGKLYVTPTDSDKIVIYDCFSGALERIYPENTQNTIFDRMLGVDENGVVYLAGIYAQNTRVIALQEKSSREILWEKNVPGQILGTGVLGKNDIYFPVEKPNNSSLYAMDTKSGTYKNMQNTKNNIKQTIRRFFQRKKQSKNALISFSHKNKNYFVLSGNNISVIQNSQEK